MHNIDSTTLEGESDEFLELLQGEGEGEWEGEGEGEYNLESGDNTEAEEEALATELLSVASEEELDHFLGKLIKKAASSIGKIARSPTGRMLGGMLKTAAKTALPVVGNAIAPGVGGLVASGVGSALGLETEGLSAEDAEWEAAKGFVRFANAAATTAAQAPPNAPPQQVAKSAVISAARQHAPGLLSPSMNGGKTRPRAASGRWIRRGNKIILLGV